MSKILQIRSDVLIEKLKRIYEKKVRAGYMTAFTLLLLAYCLTFYTTQKLADHTDNVSTIDTTINNLESLFSSIKDPETGYHRYIIYGDTAFAASYQRSIKRIDSLFQLIRSANDNSSPAKTIDTLSLLIKNKFAVIDAGVVAFNRSGHTITDSIKSITSTGKIVMDSIRRVVRRMQTNEKVLKGTMVEKMNLSTTAMKIINATSLILALILALYSIITFNKESSAKRDSDRKAAQYRYELEEKIKDLNDANQQLIELKGMEKFTATGRIARTIAHEVRNPLTNIGLAAEQLKSEIQPSDDSNLLLDMINRNSSRINQLITDLLNSTKFAQLDYRIVSINVLINEALEQAKDRMELNGIKLEKHYSTDICDVHVDSEKIKIAFLNIIVNAIEAMQPGKGVLKITTQGKNNKCVIIITDNGSGMDEETLSKLFEPYFTGKPKGTGLGLTNTQNIILNHKGMISVKSELGKGTSFFITLEFHKD